jgi:hypothetical protein
MAQLALFAVTAAIEIGSMLIRALNKPKISTAAPVINQISSSANGSPIQFGYGTVRIGGQIFWSTGISYTKKQESAKGGPSITYYTYFASFAICWGEGPLIVNRIWGDTKLIYVAPGNTSEYPIQDFPAWSATQLFNPGNIVSYSGQLYTALTVSTGDVPPTSLTNWQLISDYPPWDPAVNYSTGDVVTYNSLLYVAQAPSLDVNPTQGLGFIGGGGTTVNGTQVTYWAPLSTVYKPPTFYPGDELQMPDPTIQAVEGVANTPAYRGLGYSVFENFPLLNFGNRVPNLRAEVTYLKVRNIL